MKDLDRILRPRDVCRLVGYSNVHLRRLERTGAFPKRFSIIPGGRSVGWLESDIREWLEAHGRKDAA